MRGVLLESGSVDRYLKLGQSGYPVFDSADQILAALQRHPQWRSFFAVPQRNEQGSSIDWYSPVQGNVIAWANATDDERNAARQELHAFAQGVQDLGAKQIARGKENNSSETALFGALLQEACKIPSLSNIYLVDVGTPAAQAAPVGTSIGSLVNGQSTGTAVQGGDSRLQPVVTFWGFVDNEGDRHSRPLYFLHEQVEPAPVSAAIPVTATAPAVATVHAPVAPPPVEPRVEPPVVREPWWRRWWLWLALLLLALLLLWLLRGCVPGLGGLPAVGGLPGLPTLGVPTVNVPTLNLPSGPAVALPGAVPGVPGLPGGVAGSAVAGGAGGASLPQGDGVAPAVAPEAAPEAPALPESMPAAPEAAPEAAPQQNPPQLPEVNPEAEAQAQQPSNPLQIPANAPNGVADFLDGKYRTRGGLMDEQTSLPLNLQYAFENGKGQVEVQRSNGVSCKGDVLATVTDGQLSINSQGAANCTDGGSYVMPEVNCKVGAASMADCAASYAHQAKEFPMQMHGN